MKKTFKLIAIFCITALLALTLCGCDALDEMRASQVFYTDDGNLIYGGAEYKYLTDGDSGIDPFYNSEQTVYLTDKDVPVLLSAFFGEMADLSADERFIGNGLFIYCRADCYDEMASRIEKGFVAETYCYEYYNFRMEESIFYVLTDDEKEAVNKVITTVTPTTLPDGVSLNPLESVELELCSKDMLFRTDSFELCVTENSSYYLTDFTESDTLIYNVPDELKPVFAKILKPVTELANSYQMEDLF